MTIFDFADSINKNLVITRHSNQDERYTASFERSEVKDGCALIGEYGQGNSPLGAVIDYWNKIQGKRLVFNAMSNTHRQEFMVPIEG